ncbi:MAG TPA: DUF481 domain-containing protein [Candidatus Dormibacteraeota bacterium]|nr:DUF481 domain-containing protein [Candidatus Dormibacteraeota bacterium]
MAKFFGWYLLFTLLAALGARAQVVEFTGGDRLTGKWVSVKGDKIAFQSNMVGMVSIPVGKVKSLMIEEPVVAIVAGGKKISGKGAWLENGVWTVEAGGAGRTIASENLREIIPAAAYRQVKAETSAKPWRGWKGGTTFGYSLQQGDQQSRTLSVGVNAVRRQMGSGGISERWRTNYTFNMLFANAKSGGVEVKSNSLSTALRQDYFFRPHNFLFVLGEADHIQSQSLSLRQTYGGGYGRDLTAGKRLKISLLAGATFENQKFIHSPAEQYGEALLGEQAGIQFNGEIRFDHSLNFYPNLSSAGQFRFDTTSTLAFKLNSWLNANLGVIDFYVSRIPAGSATTVTVIGPGGTITTTTTPAHNNNLTITAGIGANF